MWATLTLLAATSLSPAQTGAIRFTNERATFGDLGPTRSDTKFVAGDVFTLSFDIENLKTDESGKVKYSMAMELLDAKGTSKYKSDPVPREVTNSVGGNRLPATANAVLGTNTEPGEYTMKVVVTDNATKKSETLTHKFTVIPEEFSLVRLSSSYDPDGRIAAPPFAVAGQSVWVNVFVGGFQRDTKKQPNITLEMQIIGEDKKPTLDKPQNTPIQVVDESFSLIPTQTNLTLNRPGKFTVELKATDLISKKTAKITFPITVVEPPK
jgi:hypothetical protein